MKNSISEIPAISIIVCHHKGGFIYKFVDSVKKSTTVSYEIIVVTSDAALAEKGIPDCLVYYNEGMPAEKRNVGARLARAPILGFFDDDVEIRSDCLYNFVFFLIGRQTAGMVYGKLHNAERRDRFDEAGGYLTTTGFIWSRAGQNDVDNGQFDKIERILAGKSASCAIRKDVFNKAGGFDEGFGILGEETDLSWRVWLQNYEVWFLPTAVGIHYFNTKWKPAKEYYTSERVHYNGCRNYLTMLIKNLGTRNLWVVPLHASIWLIVGIAMLCSLKGSSGFNILKGLGQVMRSLFTILTERKKIQENRKIQESELWPLIYRKAPKGYYFQRFSRYLRIGLHG